MQRHIYIFYLNSTFPGKGMKVTSLLPLHFPAPLLYLILLSKEPCTRYTLYIPNEEKSSYFSYLEHPFSSPSYLIVFDTHTHTHIFIHSQWVAHQRLLCFPKRKLRYAMTRHAARKSLFKCRMQIKAFIELSSQPIYYIANGSSASITLHTLHLGFAHLLFIFLDVFLFSSFFSFIFFLAQHRFGFPTPYLSKGTLPARSRKTKPITKMAPSSDQIHRLHSVLYVQEIEGKRMIELKNT